MAIIPLATIACTVDQNGISSPPYSDIYATLQAQAKAIYGTDTYIDPDSQDGEMLAVVARAQFDSNQATIATYNQFSPATAQGAGLSSNVKQNGLARQITSNSTAPITIVGQVGAVILNGVVGDNQNLGTQWALPALVTIPGGGTITVTATCTVPGATSAAPNTLSVILNPQSGWQTATNASNASPGAPVETDSGLRQRQAASTSLGSISPRAAIQTAVSNVVGVTRCLVYDNDTGAPDVNGIPARSISVVVQGGDAVAIATAIALTKAPGVPTFGTTTEVILDSQGVPDTINFFVLSIQQIDVVITGTALAGYVGSTGVAIQQAVVQYLNSLAIGGKVQWSKLFSPANLSGDAATVATGQLQAALDALSSTYDLSAITLALHGGTQHPTDVPITFNAAAAGTLVNITVNIT